MKNFHEKCLAFLIIFWVRFSCFFDSHRQFFLHFLCANNLLIILDTPWKFTNGSSFTLSKYEKNEQETNNAFQKLPSSMLARKTQSFPRQQNDSDFVIVKTNLEVEKKYLILSTHLACFNRKSE